MMFTDGIHRILLLPHIVHNLRLMSKQETARVQVLASQLMDLLMNMKRRLQQWRPLLIPA